ncbi:MAG: cold shock domain-containing protein [Patescibacteria group bacterium]
MPRRNHQKHGAGRSRTGSAFFKKLGGGDVVYDLPADNSLDDGWIGEAPGRYFGLPGFVPVTAEEPEPKPEPDLPHGVGFTEPIEGAAGVVQFYHHERGFGWIKLDHDRRTVFAHVSGLVHSNGEKPFLWKGMEVTFDVTFEARFDRWQAVHVRLTNSQSFTEWGSKRGIYFETEEDFLGHRQIYLRDRRSHRERVRVCP